jgi:hypothetical protein
VRTESGQQERKSELSGSSRSVLIAQPSVLGIALCAVLLALCVSAEAQQPARIPRIGYVTGAHLTAIAARIEALRQGLRELGYIEGKTIVIEWRSSEERPDRLPALADEFVRLKVDVTSLVLAAPLVPQKMQRERFQSSWPKITTPSAINSS